MTQTRVHKFTTHEVIIIHMNYNDRNNITRKDYHIIYLITLTQLSGVSVNKKSLICYSPLQTL